MTPQERAQKVVAEVRDHKMFDVDTDGTWERHITSAIASAMEEAEPRSEAYNLALPAQETKPDDRAPTSVGNPTTADRLAAELACNKDRPDHEPVTDSSLTYGDLRRLAKQRELLIEAERAVEEYSCRTSVPHIATEMSGLASRIRTALSEEHQQVSDAA